MTGVFVQSSRDWLQRPQAKLLAWWLPKAAIVTSLLAPVPWRARYGLALLMSACVLVRGAVASAVTIPVVLPSS